MDGAAIELVVHASNRGTVLELQHLDATSGPRMVPAFRRHHLNLHVRQLADLQQVFELLGKRAQGKTCPGIDGILEEGEEIMDEFEGTAALDAGLISAAQAVEHYEITRYGTLKRWAEELGMKDAVSLLDKTLQEESATDEALTGIADASVNDRAKQAA